jgi:hypothetical protein
MVRARYEFVAGNIAGLSVGCDRTMIKGGFAIAL